MTPNPAPTTLTSIATYTPNPVSLPKAYPNSNLTRTLSLDRTPKYLFQIIFTPLKDVALRILVLLIVLRGKAFDLGHLTVI